MAASLAALVAAAGIAAGLIRVPYDTVGPGETYLVNDVITVQGTQTFPAEGEVLYATVAVRERVSLLHAIVGLLDPNTDLIAEQRVRGDIPPEQFRQLNIEAMSDSKTAAELLALERLGFTDLGVAAVVESVSEGSPAAAVLRPGDLIVGIDGQPVRNPSEAVELIRARQPGQTIVMRVDRSGTVSDVSATLARAEDDGRPLLGVRLSTKVELPFDISIDSGDVVGPSAGLSYALQLLDVLTPGELTGGARVAATGAVSPDGAVGPVGGVAQKVVTVKRAGAKLFLVPKENEAEARRHAGNLKVVAVSTFEEALAALAGLPGSNASDYALVGAGQ